MRTLFNSLLLLVFFVCSGVVGEAAHGGDALLEEVGGAERVAVKRGGQELQLKKGDPLQVGDELVTDRKTAVDVRLADKTLIRVGVNSSYRLEGESKNLLHRMLSGIVRVLVPPTPGGKNGGVRFLLHTPEGTIGVRGTEFVVSAASGETTLRGLEGEVLFGAKNADFSKQEEFVLVKRGFQSTVKAGARPSVPREFPLGLYLREIENKAGLFAALAARAGTPVRARSMVVAKGRAAKPTISALPSKSIVTVTKAKAREMAKATDKPVDQSQVLFFAAGAGDLELVEAALKKGALVNAMHAENNTALHAAASQSQHKIIELLLKNHAQPNLKNRSGLTPLMLVALETGDAEAALQLVEGGARADEKSFDGLNALDMAKVGYEKDQEKWKELFEYLQGVTK